VLGIFSNGIVRGDGRQASHWKDNMGLGIMDPTAAPGELLVVTTLDLQGLDVVGWDLSVPEPATLGLLATMILGLAGLRHGPRSSRAVQPDA
jgi:hypothetical protein